MKKAVLCLGLLTAMATLAVAQMPTVTNETLEKFQQKRLAALRDYQKNYARMGFPSPEELDRQREDDMTARIELVNQLRQARMEEQRIALQSRSIELQAEALAYREAPVEQVGGGAGYYGGYSNSGYSNGGGYYGEGYGGGGYYGYDPYGGYYNRSRYARRYGRYGGRYGGFGGIVPILGGGYRATAVGVYQNGNGAPLPAIRRRPWGR